MSDPQRLPQAEITELELGYMRLSDAAPLIMAKEAGLFTRYGLDVSLHREVSWANLRDKLVVGKLDAAQLLAPLPMMTNLGAGGIRGSLMTGLALGLNGNAITLSNRVWESLELHYPDSAPDPLQVVQKLRSKLQQTGQTITLATVHAFSMHTILLRRWLQAGGIDLDHDVRLLVLPPEQMCDSLARGVIDGFCVGEPWNTVAVEQGIGTVAASGYHLWNNAPEKVLGVTEQWHQSHPATHLRLRLAIMEACKLLNAAPVSIPQFHVFWQYQAGFPWRSQAQSILKLSEQLLGKTLSEEERRALVQQSWRPDLYREAARWLGENSPSRDSKAENEHSQEWEFEPGIVLGADRYLALP